ncbi:MAG: NAD-dependent epimerase/dehydratase family protein, partial [Anaerolineales bacterium]|nr:NAD-dependent epimerase/dehydratase family protein [Anaerolineales bacterium]
SGEAATIFGDGQQKRDFVFVSDVVRALLLAEERDEAVGEIFNVGGGSAISILDLVRALQHIIPQAPDPVYVAPRDGDIHFSAANMERITKALGYRPTIDLKQGLETTVQWFLAKEHQKNE